MIVGVPHNSILEPLLFLIFITDIPANLDRNMKIFVDYTSLFPLVCDQMKAQQNLAET